MLSRNITTKKDVKRSKIKYNLKLGKRKFSFFLSEAFLNILKQRKISDDN